MKKTYTNKILYYNQVWLYKGYDVKTNKVILQRGNKEIKVDGKDKNLKKYTEEK